MAEVQLGSSLQVVTTVAGQIVLSLAEQRAARREDGDTSDRAISYCQITIIYLATVIDDQLNPYDPYLYLNFGA